MEKRAQLQALLLTDGSVIPKINRISFANTSNELIQRFCNLFSELYDYKKLKIGLGKGTKRKLYLVQITSKNICTDLIKDMTYNTKQNVFLPDFWFELPKKEIQKVIRNLFDADGGCSLRIIWNKKKNCFEILRTIFLCSNNSKLRKQFKKLLNNVGIKTGESSDKLTITNKIMIQKFKDEINFSENVLIGYDSKHWQGIEKRKLLDIIIKSYSIPKSYRKTSKEIQKYLTSH